MRQSETEMLDSDLGHILSSHQAVVGLVCVVYADSFCSRQPWSAYAVHLTTLSPPALLGDLLLLLLCHKATVDWDIHAHTMAMQILGGWMLMSKFIKLLGHYIRYPVDFVLLPISILFGYFHGGIKIYAVLTLNVVSCFLDLQLYLLPQPRAFIGDGEPRSGCPQP